MQYIDAHCHLYEFDEKTISTFKDISIVAVSDDLKSSLKTIYLAEKFKDIYPCIGIHPWNIEKIDLKELEEIKNLIERFDIKCLGEIGLDRKFVPQTYSLQIEVFKHFLKLASKYDLIVNLHSPNAWREVYKMVIKYNISKAIFHWYTGPLDLLKKIIDKKFYITINPAIVVQKKHRIVLENADIYQILTESDGPYNYRGLYLTPAKIRDLLKIISEIKSLSLCDLKKIILENFNRLWLK